ncbi:MAG: flagellar biosynthesis protein FlgH, partial [Alteromonas sp.]|nr:flagellar biosynthesis protein FlgH [Alteromonas sp.]
MKRILALSVAIITLGGCASTSQPPVEANDPSFAPVVPDYPRETIVEDGSLFRSYMANSLYSDVTA